MGLTSSGPVCDVCGEYILLDRDMNWFKIAGFENDFSCHDKCKPLLLAAETWRDLPAGPLRNAFSDAEDLQKKENEKNGIIASK